jgi:transcriptional regulator with PAS, ATPase and Fis domain
MSARAAHEHSPRRHGPFVAINCAAIPDALVESELFGTVRGAFTDAVDRQGALVQASGGTLFLDEIGSLSLAAQPRLLRAIENGEYRKLGGKGTEKVDVRIIAATSDDLSTLAAQGRFRSDLWFRLAILVIPIPSLRQRPEDIEPLAIHFCLALSRGRCLPSQEALQVLREYRWPGNVRELRAVIIRALALADRESGTIEKEDIVFTQGT